MNTEPLGDNIQVMVRVRPLTEKEARITKDRCIGVADGSENSIVVNYKAEPRTMSYDWVASENSTQESFFHKIGLPFAEAFMKGYNCTIFAYGQTGAGKTYTMQGKGFQKSSDEHSGLQQRVMEHIIQRLKEEESSGVTMNLKCSYYEIYNEQVIDLLDATGKKLQVREENVKKDKKEFSRVYIEGLSEESLANWEGALEVLKKGTRNRHVSSTQMNIESSRSHSVFCLSLQYGSKSSEGIFEKVSAKFNFVDLAGSERQKSTGTGGERLKEASNINKSLSTLSKVINQVVVRLKGNAVIVPSFRESKLTFILKDCFGGNSKTAIVANVSPSADSISETVSTLDFASRAKQIQNKASINTETAANIDNLKKENALLKSRLAEQELLMQQTTATTRQSMMPEEEMAFIKENNKSKQELLDTLKESVSSQIELNSKLEGEFKRKAEFETLYQKAFESYNKKEQHMKMNIQLLLTKEKRQSRDDWKYENELSMLRSTIHNLQEVNEGIPTIMQVFQENLQLKHQIVYSNVDGVPSKNMQRMIELIKANSEFMERISQKLDSVSAEKSNLCERFEKLCLLQGMSSDQINSVTLEQENENIKEEMRSVKAELIVKTQLESELKLCIEHQVQRISELEQECTKLKDDWSTEVNGLESRIRELRQSYEALGEQKDVVSNEFEMREIQYRDKISCLELKRSELLKKLGRSEQAQKDEKQNHQKVVAEFEKKVAQLQLDVMRLDEDVSFKKNAIEKYKDEKIHLKAERDSLESKLKVEGNMKDELVKKQEKLTEENSQLVAEIESLRESSDELQTALEKLRGEFDELELEHLGQTEEAGRLESNITYLEELVSSKSNQLEEMEQTVVELKAKIDRITRSDNEKADRIKQLETQVQMQAESNSPYNIAVKENHNLRTDLREAIWALDLKNKEIKNHCETVMQLKNTLDNKSQSEKYFKQALKEANEDNQKKHSQLIDLTNYLKTREMEVESYSSSQEKLNSQLKSNTILIGSLNEKLDDQNKRCNKIEAEKKLVEESVASLKAQLKKSAEENRLAHDKASESEIKLKVVQDELEFKIRELKSQLRSVNEHNTILIEEKADREEDYIRSKENLIKEIDRLSNELKEKLVIIQSLGSNIGDDMIVKAVTASKEQVLEEHGKVQKLESENLKLTKQVKDFRQQVNHMKSKIYNDIKAVENYVIEVKSNERRMSKELDCISKSGMTERDQLEKRLRVANDENKAKDDINSRLEMECEVIQRSMTETCQELKISRLQVRLLEIGKSIAMLPDDESRKVREERHNLLREQAEALKDLEKQQTELVKIKKRAKEELSNSDDYVIKSKASKKKENRAAFDKLYKKIAEHGLEKDLKHLTESNLDIEQLSLWLVDSLAAHKKSDRGYLTTSGAQNSIRNEIVIDDKSNCTPNTKKQQFKGKENIDVAFKKDIEGIKSAVKSFSTNNFGLSASKELMLGKRTDDRENITGSKKSKKMKGSNKMINDATKSLLEGIELYPEQAEEECGLTPRKKLML